MKAVEENEKRIVTPLSKQKEKIFGQIRDGSGANNCSQCACAGACRSGSISKKLT